MKRTVGLGTTQFAAEVERLKAEGKMPSLERPITRDRGDQKTFRSSTLGGENGADESERK
jgi:hypothetical protein